MIKLQVIFYSMFGHIHKMAEAIAKGASEVNDVSVEIFRVPELVPDEILIQSGAKEAQKLFETIPVLKVEQMMNADAYIFGTPTRFGSMCSQMRNLLDQLSNFAFAGKVGGVFTSTAAQHGQDKTITSFQSALVHLGMIVTGIPHAEKCVASQPSYAASLTADSKQMPSENALAIARDHGKHIAEVARALKNGRLYYEGQNG